MAFAFLTLSRSKAEILRTPKRDIRRQAQLQVVPTCGDCCIAQRGGASGVLQIDKQRGCCNEFELVTPVPNFRLFYFRASRLERSETIEAADPLDAVHEAAKRPSADLVELWSDQGRIAIFRPASRSGFE